jgi:hypothetical protein
MHDAIVTGMLCTRRHDSITQSKISGADRLVGADCRVGDDELMTRLRISSRPSATCRVLCSGVSPVDAL